MWAAASYLRVYRIILNTNSWFDVPTAYCPIQCIIIINITRIGTLILLFWTTMKIQFQQAYLFFVRRLDDLAYIVVIISYLVKMDWMTGNIEVSTAVYIRTLYLAFIVNHFFFFFYICFGIIILWLTHQSIDILISRLDVINIGEDVMRPVEDPEHYRFSGRTNCSVYETPTRIYN